MTFPRSPTHFLRLGKKRRQFLRALHTYSIDDYVAFDWIHPTQTTVKNVVVEIYKKIKEFKAQNSNSGKLDDLEFYYTRDEVTGDFWPIGRDN